MAFSKYILPCITAILAAAAMYAVQNGCSVPTPTPAIGVVHAVAVHDSISIDSLRATLQPVVRSTRVIIRPGMDESATAVDSLGRLVEMRERAFAEALAYIDTLLAALDRSQTIEDIVATHDTVLTDEEKQSLYRIRQEFSLARMEFGLTLTHDFIRQDPTIWTEVARYGPWVAGVTALLKIMYDSFLLH